MDIPSEMLAHFVGLTSAPEPLATQLLQDSGLDLEAAIASFFAIQDAGGLPRTPSVSSDEIASSSPPPSPLSAVPATHPNFSGSFERALLAALHHRKWLLVSLHRFDAATPLRLDRDVWPHPRLATLVAQHFLLWNRDHASRDGAHYKQFYPFQRAPHVALIDPRSGERLRVWGGDGHPIERDALTDALAAFICRNSLDDEHVIPSEAPPTRAGTSTAAAAAPSTRPGSSADDDDSDILMSEDAALAAAIAASMESAGNSDGDSDAREAARESGWGAALLGLDAVNERPASRLLSATDPALNRNRSLREQQDNEFKESLALDRAKELSEQAEAERMEREAVEAVRKTKAAAEAREMKRRRVPQVPGPDCTDRITELAVRLPTGGRLQRKFYATDTVGNVYDYVETEVEELSQRNFELVQAYPRKGFTDRGLRLGELPAKAALVVHLLD